MAIQVWSGPSVTSSSNVIVIVRRMNHLLDLGVILECAHYTERLFLGGDWPGPARDERACDHPAASLEIWRGHKLSHGHSVERGIRHDDAVCEDGWPS